MVRRESAFLKLLTNALLAASLMLGGLIAFLFMDPQSEVNPYPPPTLPAISVLATPSDTPEPPAPGLEPTTAAVEPGLPAATPLPATATATEIPAAAATLVVVEKFPYALQAGTIGYTSQFTHPELACKWIGVAGSVFDASGNPVSDLLVHVEGPDEFWMDDPTGNHAEYGASGFEVALPRAPFESRGQYRVTLQDLMGRNLSAAVALDTFADCEKNLLLVNFSAVP